MEVRRGSARPFGVMPTALYPMDPVIPRERSGADKAGRGLSLSVRSDFSPPVEVKRSEFNDASPQGVCQCFFFCPLDLFVGKSRWQVVRSSSEWGICTGCTPSGGRSRRHRWRDPRKDNDLPRTEEIRTCACDRLPLGSAFECALLWHPSDAYPGRMRDLFQNQILRPGAEVLWIGLVHGVP